MKNVLNEKPTTDLSARLHHSLSFVDDNDIKNKTVLDIGCGFGWCELNFLDRGVKQITGIEISPADLVTAKASIRDPRVKFVVGSATNLPFPDKSFDTVVSWEVIEHIPDRKEEIMVQEVGRVLRPGGSFYLSTPHRSFWSNVLDPAWWLTGHRHYSKKQLTRYGRGSGFAVTDMKVRGGFWTELGIPNMYLAKWLFRRGLFFAGFFTKKEWQEYDRVGGTANIFAKFVKSQPNASTENES